jgi:hypothetical protein
MDIYFVEVGALQIREHYPSYFHEKACYFKAMKDGKTLCLYGIISRSETTGEAFLMMKTFNGIEGRPPKVLSKGFFVSLFAHVFSLGYKEIYTWTKWERLKKLFCHFKRFGIETTSCPPWGKDSDPTKTWFIKRIQ